jgi:hypothetical protein
VPIVTLAGFRGAHASGREPVLPYKTLTRTRPMAAKKKAKKKAAKKTAKKTAKKKAKK